MKKLFAVSLLALMLAMGMGGVAVAAPSDPAETLPPAPISSTTELEAIINTIINWVFFIFIAIAVVMIILAGLQFVTAGGDPTAVSQARTKLIWAAVGIGVALAANGFRPVVSDLLFGASV